MQMCLEEDPKIREKAIKSSTRTVSIAMKNRGHQRKKRISRDYNPFENGDLLRGKTLPPMWRHYLLQKDVLIRILHDMGFTSKHSVSKITVLVERGDTDTKRDIWTHISLRFQKCWQGPGTRGVMATVSGVTAHTGPKAGFLPGIQLVYNTSGDYQGRMNYDSAESHTKSFPTCRPTVQRLWKCITNLGNMRRTKTCWISCRSIDFWVTFKLEICLVLLRDSFRSMW
jgi:hypothetical protein